MSFNNYITIYSALQHFFKALKQSLNSGLLFCKNFLCNGSYQIAFCQKFIAVGFIHCPKARDRFFYLLNFFITRKAADKAAVTDESFVERVDVKDDLAYLLQEEIKFWNYVQRDVMPPLRLPEI